MNSGVLIISNLLYVLHVLHANYMLSEGLKAFLDSYNTDPAPHFDIIQE